MSAEQQGDVEEQTQTSLSNTPQPTPRVPEEKENESATVGDQVKEAEDSTPQISEETNGDSADPAAPTVEATENSQDNDAKVIAENAADVTTSSGAEEQPTSDANMKEGEQADGSKTSNDHDQGSARPAEESSSATINESKSSEPTDVIESSEAMTSNIESSDTLRETDSSAVDVAAPKSENVSRGEVAKSSEDAVAKSSEDAVAKSSEDAVAKASEDAVAKAAEDAVAKASEDAVAKSSEDAVAKSSEDAVAKSSEDAVAKSSEDAGEEKEPEPGQAPNEGEAAPETVTHEASGATVDSGDGAQSPKPSSEELQNVSASPTETAGEEERTKTPQPSAAAEDKESDEDKVAGASRPASSGGPSRSASRGKEGGPPPPPEMESKVASATPMANITTKPEEDTQPLNLKWTFGMNRNIACLNLSDGLRSLILFGAAHVAVLYDYKNNSQKLLQGHGNAVTCIACSEDKRWLVTGDEGPGSCIIIWDSYTGSKIGCPTNHRFEMYSVKNLYDVPLRIPVQTIFNVNGGVVALSMSSDAKYIVAIGARTPQIISVWDWTTSVDQPLHQVELNVASRQTYVKFHPHDNEQFVSNSDSQVIFYSWASGNLQCDTPFLSDSVFNRPVGFFSQSIFQVAPSNRALTATSLGNLVVWAPDRVRINGEGYISRHPLKLLRVKDRSITALTQVDGFVVTGDTAGHVRFFDRDLNLLNWYQKLNAGSVNSISFDYVPDFATDLLSEKNEYPKDATLLANTFAVRDFVVSTRSSEIVHVQANGSVVTSVLREHDAAVHALDASPNRPWICVGSYAGLLKLWNYETKSVMATRLVGNKEKIQCLAFSHNGLQIAVGMLSGVVHVVDSLTLGDEVTFDYSSDTVTHCAFSHDSTYLATADKQFTTTVFKYHKTTGWTYLGRYRAHYKTIMDLTFGVDLDSNQHRLLTLGEDRVLVEYDLASSSKDDLRLSSVDRIEQSAVPLCLKWYPPVTKETFLVAANNQYKMKLFNTTTKMCRKTMLGPTYGSPVRLMSIIPPKPGEDPTRDRLMTYATSNKVGLQLLPLDGNPHRSVALIAHPSGVSSLCSSYNGQHVFTAGGGDASVHMWSVNSNALKALEALGGDDLTPFYGLIDGGREGEMFAELENYFYFAQLRSQGLETTEEREVSTSVKLDQVPFILRALGFYPTEQEIEDILNEVKFSNYVDTGDYVTEIDLADFIKLYVNHRPAFGISPTELEDAFAKIGRLNENGEAEIDRGALLEILQRKGEHMTEDELADCLATLLGYNPEGGRSSSNEPWSVDVASKQLEDALPETIVASSFVNEVLALNTYDD